MISKNFIIIVVFIAAKSATADFNELISERSIRTDCIPNKVYEEDGIICICTSDGQWPHKNCSLVFTPCPPSSYIKVDCNICACNNKGSIDFNSCTKHDCSTDSQNTAYRRFNSLKTQCKPNHWYALSTCRICYCINERNLLCSSGVFNPNKLKLDKYNLTDCGLNFLHDVSKLPEVKNSLRLGNNNEDIESLMPSIPTKTRKDPMHPKHDVLSMFMKDDDNSEDKVLIPENDDESDEDNNLKSNIYDEAQNVQQTAEYKPIARIAGNTEIPFYDFDSGSNDLEDDRKDSGSEVGSSKESKDTLDMHIVAEPAARYNERTQKQTENEEQRSQEHKSFVKVNIPGVLEKVFNFRRSMVSLDNADCLPGSTVTVDCNTCFCLKNGKMLCTQKICKKKNSMT